MQALILAAGMGRRLKELTRNNTKCMVKVNGVTLIERMLRQLEQKQLSRIVIVVGYEGKKLVEFIGTLGIQTPIVYLENPIYEKTNNIYSLSLAKEYLCREDTLLFESDLIFEESAIDLLLEDPRETLALVDRYQSWMDGTCVKLAEGDRLEAIIPGKKFDFQEKNSYYKTVNIYKFGKEFSRTHYVPFLEAYTQALGNNEYYEQVLRVLMMLDEPGIQGKRLNGQKWYEIDDVQDLDIATTLFASDAKEQLALIQRRYGGYWRYPGLLDFCYLVNPYYPPQKLVEEMQASFTKLLTQYPSGMEVQTLLAGRCFGIHPENVVVGNGAAELIKALLERSEGRLGIVRPTFEEYSNRCKRTEPLCFYPETEGFRYTAQDLISYFDGRDIEMLVVVNPDNPSGNYIPRQDLQKLLLWSEKTGVRLVIDESFVDFSDESDGTLLEQQLLEEHPSLVVVKSISKSYGVPGLRLGVLASGDQSLISTIKKDVSIWNINSFAEFYLQIAEKYKQEYRNSLELLRAERQRFASELAKLPGVTVYPSQANYLLIQLKNGRSAEELTQRLLAEHQILVKDLTAKTRGGNYLRIAVRSRDDNERLLCGMERILLKT